MGVFGGCNPVRGSEAEIMFLLEVQGELFVSGARACNEGYYQHVVGHMFDLFVDPFVSVGV